MRAGRLRTLTSRAIAAGVENGARILAHRREKADQAKRKEAPGKTSGRSVGGWVSDLASLGTSIMMCSGCEWKWKWSAQARDYEKHKRWSKVWGGVIGKCDGCGENGHQRAFYHHADLRGKI